MPPETEGNGSPLNKIFKSHCSLGHRLPLGVAFCPFLHPDHPDRAELVNPDYKLPLLSDRTATVDAALNQT